MNHEKEFYPEEYRMDPAKPDVIREGKDALMYCTGSILEEADKACALLEQEGTAVKLVNVCCIKPFPAEELLADADRYGRVITVEEHNVHGGLGSLAAETLAYHGGKAGVIPVGLPDVFAEGYGTQLTVRENNDLDAQSICRRVKEAFGNE